MVPNWLGATFSSNAGLIKSETMKSSSSAIFERAGAREIGRSSFLGSDTCLTFGRGEMSASFQTEGSFCSLYKAFTMSLTGCAKNATYSFNTQFGSPSGAGS